MNDSRVPRVGLVLGSGSARGWAHIGAIRALEQAGIRPDLVCGTSVGALVSAVYAAGELDRFEHWLLGLGLRDVVSFMDVRLNGGVLKGKRLMDFFQRNFVDRPIEDLPMPFGAVATDLSNGAEVWLRTGSTVEAVRASIALPALFAPAVHNGRVLVDGALVNPVPVSLGRAMGADIVIAVDLSSDRLGRYLRNASEATADETAEESGLGGSQVGEWLKKLQGNLGSLIPTRSEDAPRQPSMIEVMTASLNIMQTRIARSRMAGEPPDAVISPHLGGIGLLDFHRASETIEEGRRATEVSMPALRALGLGSR